MAKTREKHRTGGRRSEEHTNLPAVIPQPESKPESGIAKPGLPNNPTRSLEMVNKDNYSKGGGYTINCQRCVWAYEMNRRGYTVEAKPNTDGLGRGNRWLSIAPDAKGEYLLNFQKGGKNKDVEAKAIEKMKEWGDGSRGIIQMSRRSCSGHVFNVEYSDGKITVYEAQTGEKHKSLATYLTSQKAMPGFVALIRSDNVTLKESEFPKYVKQKEKKK